MDFPKVFLERKSVRAYADASIPDEIRDKVLAAALRAPTAAGSIKATIRFRIVPAPAAAISASRSSTPT